MNPIVYLSEVRRTMNPERVQENALLGLRGESGEVADVVKKIVCHGLTMDEKRDAMVKELGDSLWYGVEKCLIPVEGSKSGEPLLKDPVICAALSLRRIEINDMTLTELADQFCGAADKLAHSTMYFEAIDSLTEFVTFMQAIGARWAQPITMSEIMEANANKLRKRYPAGFTKAASIARADVASEDAQTDRALREALVAGDLKMKLPGEQ